MSLHLRNVRTRVATGAYILRTGLSKWHGAGLHEPGQRLAQSGRNSDQQGRVNAGESASACWPTVPVETSRRDNGQLAARP